jgi:hypothetical protein
MRRGPGPLTGVLVLALLVSLLANSWSYPVSAAPVNLPATWQQRQMDCAVFLGEGRLIATALAILDSIKPLLNQLIDSISASLTGSVGSLDNCEKPTGSSVMRGRGKAS